MFLPVEIQLLDAIDTGLLPLLFEQRKKNEEN